LVEVKKIPDDESPINRCQSNADWKHGRTSRIGKISASGKNVFGYDVKLPRHSELEVAMMKPRKGSQLVWQHVITQITFVLRLVEMFFGLGIAMKAMAVGKIVQ
jgi:hypothetical protein